MIVPPSLTVIWQPDTTIRWDKEPREYGWIRTLLSAFQLEDVFDGSYEYIADNPLVVVDGSNYEPEVVLEYLSRLKTGVDKNVGVIHIGDEHAIAPLDIYEEASFVYRNYWRPEMKDYPHCSYLPLGLNCPSDAFAPKPIRDRSFRWSFAGQARATRQAMVNSVANREDGHLILNETFNSGLNKKDYANLLCDTQIVLCPRGWSSVESYRVYEALEAGAIPLVEDDGGWGLFREHSRLEALYTASKAGPRYWYNVGKRMIQPSYWLSAYGAEFPCPRIYRWENLDTVMQRIDPVRMSSRIARWWDNTKVDVQKELTTTIQENLRVDPSTNAVRRLLREPE
jgi:hypothetical protein